MNNKKIKKDKYFLKKNFQKNLRYFPIYDIFDIFVDIFNIFIDISSIF